METSRQITQKNYVYNGQRYIIKSEKFSNGVHIGILFYPSGSTYLIPQKILITNNHFIKTEFQKFYQEVELQQKKQNIQDNCPEKQMLKTQNEITTKQLLYGITEIYKIGLITSEQKNPSIIYYNQSYTIHKNKFKKFISEHQKNTVIALSQQNSINFYYLMEQNQYQLVKNGLNIQLNLKTVSWENQQINLNILQIFIIFHWILNWERNKSDICQYQQFYDFFKSDQFFKELKNIIDKYRNQIIKQNAFYTKNLLKNTITKASSIQFPYPILYNSLSLLLSKQFILISQPLDNQVIKYFQARLCHFSKIPKKINNKQKFLKQLIFIFNKNYQHSIIYLRGMISQNRQFITTFNNEKISISQQQIQFQWINRQNYQDSKQLLIIFQDQHLKKQKNLICNKNQFYKFSNMSVLYINKPLTQNIYDSLSKLQIISFINSVEFIKLLPINYNQIIKQENQQIIYLPNQRKYLIKYYNNMYLFLLEIKQQQYYKSLIQAKGYISYLRQISYGVFKLDLNENKIIKQKTVSKKTVGLNKTKVSNQGPVIQTINKQNNKIKYNYKGQLQNGMFNGHGKLNIFNKTKEKIFNIEAVFKQNKIKKLLSFSQNNIN